MVSLVVGKFSLTTFDPLCQRIVNDVRQLAGIATGNSQMGKQNSMRQPVTICLINQKGGCGKSSTCFHLAGALAKEGMRVLLVDADPQGSLSQGFLGSALVESLPVSETMAALFDDETYFLDYNQLPRPTLDELIQIVPANQHLARHNFPMPETTGLKQFAVRNLLEELSDFDIVLIDCPPNLYLCSWNAMIAADYVVIPVPPEDFGTQGLRTVHQAVENVRELNPKLRRLGHLISRYDRRLLVHRSYERELRKLYQEMVLDTLIPEAAAFKVALTARMPVTHHAPRSRAANMTRELAKELLERIADHAEKRRVA